MQIHEALFCQSIAEISFSFQVFASVGGLALLAEHLPLLYQEISHQITSPSSGESTPNLTKGGENPNDWVTVENYPEDLYMVGTDVRASNLNIDQNKC